MDDIKDQLAKLVFNFRLSNFRGMNESQTRLSYIDKFWEHLGWQVRNTDEVRVETTDKQSKRPDYRFLKGNKTLFFVEAKKPAEDLKNPRHIYQTKLYCWNGNVPLAILTDFEEFRPFRSIGKPSPADGNKGIIKQFDLHYEEYPDRAYDLINTFGREAVLAGSLNNLLKPTQIELRDTVDRHFLNTLSKWRTDLATQIARTNKFSNEFDLAEAVQRILDRLVFLRILQDREIENEDFMCGILKNNNLEPYPAFLEICKELAPKYNGLIFNPHPLSENLKIEGSLFKKIVKELDFEDSPYRFDEIPVEMLGTIYERFLGDEISLDKKGKVAIDQKPEVRKAGGVYYTPQYIVEYIVQNTVGKLLENRKTPADVAKLKILDPACGSGSFLLGAFDALIKWHEDYFSAHPTDIIEKTGKQYHKLAYLDDANKTRLTARMKGKILQNNLFGVDLDKQATEVAQMSLYIKVLEGMANEGVLVLGFQDAILPKLDGNIKCGNSLIGSDFIHEDFFGLSEREKHKINPFDWEDNFPEIIGAKKMSVFHHVTFETKYSRMPAEHTPKDYTGEFVVMSNEEREIFAKCLVEKINQLKFKLLAVAILPDHVHLIIADMGIPIEKIVNEIKGYAAYTINHTLKGVVAGEGRQLHHWAKRYSDTVLNSEEHIFNAIEYVNNNYLKHEEKWGKLDNNAINHTLHGLAGTATALDNHTLQGVADTTLGAVQQASTGVSDHTLQGLAGTLSSLDNHTLQGVAGTTQGVADTTLGAVQQSSTGVSDHTLHGLAGTATALDNHTLQGVADTTLGAVQQASTGVSDHTLQGLVGTLSSLDNHTLQGVAGTTQGVVDSAPGIHQKATTTQDHTLKGVVVGSSAMKDVVVGFTKWSDYEYSAGGFDAVIGNPPYISIQSGYIDNKIYKYLLLRYSTIEGISDFFGIFTEKSLNLLRKNGFWSFIIPSTILGNLSFTKLRKKLLYETYINEIAHFGDGVFEEAVVPTCVISICKNAGQNEKIKIMKNIDDYYENKYQVIYTSQSIFLEQENFIFNLKLTCETQKIINKIKLDKDNLDKYIDIKEGIKTGNDKRFLSPNPFPQNSYRVLKGRDIDRYNLSTSLFIDYDIENLSRPQKIEHFIINEKLFIRRVGSNLVATYDDNQNFCVHTLYTGRKKVVCEISLKYLLGLINSRLLNTYQDITKAKKGEVFPEIRIYSINQLPIKPIDFSNPTEKAQHDQLVELVNKMLKLNKDKQTASEFDRKHMEQYIARTDREIDALVYQLYGLTDEEIKIVEGK